MNLNGPFRLTEEVFADKYLFISDVDYHSSSPNGCLDMILQSEEKRINSPLLFYIHGGGYCWGDKKDITTLGNGTISDIHIRPFLDESYNIISINYALAPEYNYPVPVYQINEAFRFLRENKEKFGISLDNVVLSGSSAGGQLAGQYSNIVTNPDYSRKMNIEPCLRKSELKAVLFASALLDMKGYDETDTEKVNRFFAKCIRAYFNRWNPKKDKRNSEADVILNITKDFPPSYISDGNTETFNRHAVTLYEKLKIMNIPCFLNIYDPGEVRLSHGYENLDTPEASENRKKAVDFLKRIIGQ